VRVIDFRVRPPVAGFEAGRMYAAPARTAAMSAAFGFPDPAPTLAAPGSKAFETELAAAALELCVIPGRVGAPDVGPADNGALVGYAAANPALCVFPAIDPHAEGWRVEADRLLGERCVRGLTLEPGLLERPVYPDDPACLPVYELCAARGVPLILSAGGNVGPDCSYTAPEHVDRVARDFPRLDLVIAHGGWPWITGYNHVAFRRGNVYLSPDMYALMPGNEAYLAAMNGYLSERYVYATSFPFVPLRAYRERFLRIVANDAVAERVLHANAARLLRLA